MPFGTLLLWNNLDTEVISNIPGLLKFTDIIFLIMPLSVTFLSIRYKNEIKTSQINAHTKWIYTGAALLLFVAGQLRMIKNEIITNERDQTIHNFEIRYLMPRWCEMGDVADIGFSLHTLKAAALHCKELMTNGKLSDSDRTIIERHLKEKSRSSDCISDSIDNRNKNVIFIIVESLNSWVIGKKYGPQSISYTPTLDSLINNPSTIYNLNIKSQVKNGMSSDGQLMYNTGLLPLRNDVVVGAFGNNRFPSLAEQLDKPVSFEVIYETPRLWNHDVTTKSYHYDSLYSQRDIMGYADENGWEGKDGLLFRFAFDKIKETTVPFFCEVTTLSMHAPFKDERATYAASIDSLKDINETHRSYLRCVNYFDTQLGIFLNKLKTTNIYDNSLIIIASDHDLTFHDKGIPEGKSEIAFIALNTGLKKGKLRNAEQIDVYPTILDLCSVRNPKFGWRGMGRSMLSDATSPSTTHDWDISEKIIKSNYFKHIETDMIK